MEKRPFVYPARMEIYRGYDTVAKKMLYPDELEAIGFSMSAKGKPSHPHIVPMALTPIIDETHAPIYEGDICEMGVVVNNNIGLVRTRGWMGWDPPQNHYTLFYELDQPLLKQGSILKATGIRKVGNVFENPDLLSIEEKVPAELVGKGSDKPGKAPKRPVAKRSPRKPARVSECCNAGIAVDIFEDPSLVGGSKPMYSCKACGKACTIKDNGGNG